jgi:bla regulator protein blaR1
MIILIYLLKTILISGLLFAYYWMFLRNKQFHQYNRFYLLSIPFISLCLPLFNIPFPGLSFANNNISLKLLKVITVTDWEPEVVITAHRSWINYLLSWQNILWAIYITVVLLLFYLLMQSVFYIIRISKKYTYEKIGDIKIFQTEEAGTPFSFLKNIFWNNEIEMSSKKGEQVFRHELYHVKQKHTGDILCMELISTVCWFNPFFYLIKKEIKIIHEFLADQYAASSTNKFDYAELLVWQSAACKQLSITNYFFHNEIKRRIMMITKFKNTRYGYISRLMALPLLFVIFCAFAVKITNKKPVTPVHSNKMITIAIDAGHGGIDDGVKSNSGIFEKEINLSIAKKIQQLSNDYNVNVIMTREADILPGNASTVKEGLINRINIAEKNKAAVLISIHMDATINNKPANGFSVYLSDNNPYYKKSILLGSSLTDEIKKTCAIYPELKRRQHPIKVLASANMPSVMIDCGYMTNKNDLDFIVDEKNQEQIAKDILEGVMKYSNSAYNILNTLIQTNQDTIIKKDAQQKKSDKAYTKVEFEADYPGGHQGWTEYLMKNLKYPEQAVKKEIQGVVVAQFIVNIDGSLSDIKIIKSPNKLLSDETLRIIKNSGNWTPAVQNGSQIRSYKRQPIVFKLVV